MFVAKHEYRDCVVRVKEKGTSANLVLMDMMEFNVILGMDWLSPNYVSVDCHHKRVRFDYIGETPFYIQKDRNMALISMISAMTTNHLMTHGGLGFLAMVIDTLVNAISVVNVPIMREFIDVFSEELLGLPPK
ncbi:Gag protease polyprotein, putative [Theobroma cacao]|uniref:Gag protease polyprotein, putative n=1 Tax=Theobroma cacao TaxID=3641 RepID=A0A061DPB8_THECC|nr:Gag protease polyprotein, putative [Theobroma cacao]